MTALDQYEDFDALDRLRLEVEQAPNGIVNMVPNPNGEGGGWGWITPPATSTMQGDDVTVPGTFQLTYGTPSPSAAAHFYTERMPVTAGQYVGAKWQGISLVASGHHYRARLWFTNSTGAFVSEAGLTGYLTAPGAASIAAQVVPATATAVQLRFDVYSNTSGANPFGGVPFTFNNVVVGQAATAADINTNLAYYVPTYLDILGPTHAITINREGLNIGTLVAEIRDATLDPSQGDEIRPGRVVRMMVQDAAGVWDRLFTGKIQKADVTYDAAKAALGDPKHAHIKVSALDNTSRLAQEPRPYGVEEIHHLPVVLEGAGVPWRLQNITSQISALIAPIVSNIKDATALDQVAITRDSDRGYAYVDRYGVLVVDPVGAIGTPPVLDEDDYQHLGIAFATDDCINVLTIKSVEPDPANPTVSHEVDYGPYVDTASVREWGAYAATMRVQGKTSGEIATLAAQVLAANATPAVRVNQVTLPIKRVADLTTTKALIDPTDLVTVSNTAKAIDVDLRVVTVTHEIASYGWRVHLGFAKAGSVAMPIATTAPAPAAVGPSVSTGWTSVNPGAGWTAGFGGGAAVLYKKSSDGIVTVHLAVTRASWALNDVICPAGSIPTGSRPRDFAIGSGINSAVDNAPREWYIRHTDGAVVAARAQTGSILGLMTYVAGN